MANKGNMTRPELAEFNALLAEHLAQTRAEAPDRAAIVDGFIDELRLAAHCRQQALGEAGALEVVYRVGRLLARQQARGRRLDAE